MAEERTAVELADEALLADLGYKQEFKRCFTGLEVFGIAFSIIGLLPSIAAVLTYPLGNGGASAMVWGWLVGSIFTFFVGLAMAELASSAPTSGGLYFWTHSLSSPRSANFLSWIVGYANTVGSIAAVASIDWGCAVQVQAAVAIGNPGFEVTNAQLFGIYAAIVVSHIILCSLATPVLARLQTVYVALNVLLCLAVLIALPIAVPNEYRNTASYALGDFTNLSGWPGGFAFILALLSPLWTICSFDSSVHISEEASNAATAVPYAIVYAIAIAGVLGTAVNIALAFCMGTDLDGLLNSSVNQPMAQIFLNAFGQNGTLGVWAIVVVVQYMMGSSMLLAASRQTFAFARDGALPLSGWLYRINSFTQTPVNTVIFDAVCSILLGLLVFAGSSAINAIFSLSVVALYVAYSIPISVRFIYRKENNFKPGPFNLGRWSAPVAFVAVAWMTLFTVVFLFPSGPLPEVPEMNYTVVVLFGTLFLSVVWYYFPKYGGVHWFTGPVRTISEDSASETDAKFDEKKIAEDHVTPVL